MGSLVGPVDGPVVTVVCPVRQRRCCPLLSGGALPGVVVPPGRIPAVLHQGASSQGQVTRPWGCTRTHTPIRLNNSVSLSGPSHQTLLEKLNESLCRPGSRLAALTLLGHLIRKQPPWVHHISRSPLLASLLRCLKVLERRQF